MPAGFLGVRCVGFKLRRTDGVCGESAMGDVIWMGIGVVSFAALALYVFGCARA